MRVVRDGLSDLPSLVYVRPNLYGALRYLRDLQSEQFLWIDAICINQADIRERNHEVLKMAQIYTLASRTIVWLGNAEAHDSSKRAFEILASIGKQFERLNDDSLVITPGSEDRSATEIAFLSIFKPPWSSLTVAVDMKEAIEPIYSGADWEAIEKILNCSWWGRLWIYQEAMLGYRKAIVRCGTDSIPLYVLTTSIAAAILYGKHMFGSRFNASLIRQCAGLFPDHMQRSTLHVLLIATQTAQYMDKHDRIYALLGLAPPEYRANIEVDYSRHVFDLFYDTCVAMVDLGERLTFLHFCDWELGMSQAKPTWVPDWNRNRLEILRPSSWADGNITTANQNTIDGPHLNVEAVLCDRVQYVAALDVGDVYTLLSLTKLAAELNGHKCTHTIDMLKRELIIALTNGRVRDFYPEATGLGTVDEILSHSDDYELTFNGYNYHKGRSVFITNRGQLGLGPKFLLPGMLAMRIFFSRYQPRRSRGSHCRGIWRFLANGFTGLNVRTFVSTSAL